MSHKIILFEGGKIIGASPAEAQAGPFRHSINKINCRVNETDYISTLNKLLQHIHKGDIYEINYCIEFYAENVSIDPYLVFERLKTFTEAPFAQLLKTANEWIICASPERFLKKEGNKLVTQPMKGTARRSTDTKEDERIKNALQINPKERSENVMAVDVARNDLSVIAEKGSVVTEKLFGIHSFKNVHQLVSTVSCALKENRSFESIISATFPPASMTGAPKLKAIELIKKYELSPRGIYSGCLGEIKANGDFDLSVVIRTIIYDEKTKRLSFHTGSAITAQCDPKEEWKECLLKAETMIKALGLGLENISFPL